jgi:cyclopropane fatty-acyl-phospholipid synthase-like methyltransferase
MMDKDFSKNQFLQFWGNEGYIETWDGDKRDWSQEIMQLVVKEIGVSKDKTVVEIGCGGGYWTKKLCAYAKHVYAIDIIPSLSLSFDNYTYYENSDKQFNCNQIQNNSVDFIFSFGVFCHFSKEACEEYLLDFKRILKKGGSAILMFADQKGLQKFYETKKVNVNDIFGEAINYKNAQPFVKRHFKNTQKILDFRHSLFLVKN